MWSLAPRSVAVAARRPVAVRAISTHIARTLAVPALRAAPLPRCARCLSTPAGPKSPAAHDANAPKDETRPPVSNADERTDAEAGLNEPVRKVGEEEEEEPAAPKPVLPVTWQSLAFLVIGGGAALIYTLYSQEKSLNTVKVESIGTPDIGGPWSLIDDESKRVSNETLKGRYVLMYFGFTFCPDICPRELGRMDEVLKKLDGMNLGQQVVPLFISLDPKRDTPVRMRAYKTKFNPAIQWLTGTDEELAAMAKAFRIYYSASETLPGEDDDYMLDHSIFFYLMDKEGKFGQVFGQSETTDEIAVRTANFIRAENR